jgi:excisionase family DNA binding protein
MTAAALAQPGEKLLYRVEEAAQMLAVGRSKMWEIVLRGDIESLKIDKSRRISREALAAYIANLEGSAAARSRA